MLNPTPVQRAVLARRYQAAERLELARQVARESKRYGFAAIRTMQIVHQAEVAYDEATRAVEETFQGCGTNGGYQRHLRNDEPVDDACRGAHNTYNRDNRALHIRLQQYRLGTVVTR